jgi:hypothetical protein
MPSTVCPPALLAVDASGAACGIGTPSGPSGPGEGAGFRVPRLVVEVVRTLGDDPEPLDLLLLLPPEVADTIATTTPTTIATPTPPPI